MKNFIALLIFLLAFAASAKPEYEMSAALPSSSPFYNTNVTVLVVTNMGGQQAQTIFTNGTTITNALLSPLIISGPYDNFDFQFSSANLSNSSSTLIFSIYAVRDGVNYFTNQPIWSATSTVTTSNSLFGTNISAAICGSCANFVLGVQNSGTNSLTGYVQFFRRARFYVPAVQ